MAAPGDCRAPARPEHSAQCAEGLRQVVGLDGARHFDVDAPAAWKFAHGGCRRLELCAAQRFCGGWALGGGGVAVGEESGTAQNELKRDHKWAFPIHFEFCSFSALGNKGSALGNIHSRLLDARTPVS